MKLRAGHWCGLAAAIVIPIIALAAGENTIPYTESFEGYAPDYAITNNTGWSVGDVDFIAIITNVPDHGLNGGYMPYVHHTNVLDIWGCVSNAFVKDLALTNVYVDMLVKPQGRIRPPTKFDQLPLGDEGLPQTAICVLTNGDVAFFHAYFNLSQMDYIRVWSTNSLGIPTNEWASVFVTAAYKTSAYGDGYLRIEMNGTALSGPLGYSYAGAADVLSLPDGGQWFICANVDAVNDRWLRAVVVDGIGHMDDLAVMTNPPPQFTSNGTPYWWLESYGLVTNGALDSQYEAASISDSGDSDGKQAWEEFQTGTDPTDPGSVFELTEIDINDGDVVWYGGSNQAWNLPFKVYRTPSLTEDWVFVATRDRSLGTNNVHIWRDLDAGTYTTMFYQVRAPTE